MIKESTEWRMTGREIKYFSIFVESPLSILSTKWNLTHPLRFDIKSLCLPVNMSYCLSHRRRHSVWMLGLRQCAHKNRSKSHDHFLRLLLHCGYCNLTKYDWLWNVRKKKNKQRNSISVRCIHIQCDICCAWSIIKILCYPYIHFYSNELWKISKWRRWSKVSNGRNGVNQQIWRWHRKCN